MWIQISSGKGPDECELAVSRFLRSYQNECDMKGINLKVINAIPGNLNGTLKSVLLSLETQDEVNFEDCISGTILWICKSPYRPYHKRKNWFMNIEIFNSPEKLSFSEKDIKFEALKSSGPGGQNVNKVETTVRATHIPTGLVVTASEERSQYMNKKLALARLYNLIETKNNATTHNNKKSLWLQHNILIRGNPIRIYEGEEFKLKPSK